LLAAQERVARAANNHGTFAATVGSPESLERLLDIGYRFVNLGVDILAIGSDCRRCAEAAESAAAARFGV
jgi:4-hydroxy-2-oxoheptanedioate aldolase